MERRKFVFHSEIRKQREDDDTLIIEGFASTAGIDRVNDIVSPEAIKSGIAAFRKNPILLYQHYRDLPIGKIVEMTIDEYAGFFVRAMISKADDVKNIATKIKEEILRAFSISFIEKDSEPGENGTHIITKLELLEVSIVTVPANKDTLFSVTKAFEHGTDLIEYDNPDKAKEPEPKKEPPPDPPAQNTGVTVIKKDKETILKGTEFKKLIEEVKKELQKQRAEFIAKQINESAKQLKESLR